MGLGRRFFRFIPLNLFAYVFDDCGDFFHRQFVFEGGHFIFFTVADLLDKLLFRMMKRVPLEK